MADRETARVEAFSDGVFAIAVTLLILEIRLPHLPAETSSTALLHELLGLWPSYLAFILSFGTILIMWINHHGLFKLVHRFDRRAMFANGFLLMMVTFVNFPTAVLADHLEQSSAGTAAAFYCGTYVMISISYLLLFAAVRPYLALGQTEHPKPGPARRVGTVYLLGLVLYCTATAVAFISPTIALAICAGLLVLWIVLDYQKGAGTGAG